MTAEELINGDMDITLEMLDQLSDIELRIIASKLFEIKDPLAFSRDQLLYQCREILVENQHKASRKTVEDFIRNQDNQTRAVKMALNIRSAFDRNWFEVEELLHVYKKNMERNAQKLKDKPQESEKIFEEIKALNAEKIKAELATLSLFGLVKKQSFKGGRKVKYRIVMTVVVTAMEREKKLKEKQKQEENDRSSTEVSSGT